MFQSKPVVRRNKTRQRAFTLIEVLVVVAIIALLVAILIPSLAKARANARSAVCTSNLHQFGIAITAYQTEHDGYIPRGGTHDDPAHWILLVARMVGDKRNYTHVNQVPVENHPVFTCPERTTTYPGAFIDYVINAMESDGSGEAMEPTRDSEWKRPGSILLLGDAARECPEANDTGYPALNSCPSDPVGACNGQLKRNRLHHPSAMQLEDPDDYDEDLHASLDQFDIPKPKFIQTSDSRRAGTITHMNKYCNWLHADGHAEVVQWHDGKRTHEQWLRMYGIKNPW